ncbi:hypothetical protein BC936DRAFT_149757 [Jimgerdemannia flammicorona]|uniref:Uncharacterized protein n=1 Tax=Jimgerdemannia flammicorona TaxID=994334 RepID=A0A433D062_9FUNG|nr:hypothetical protein BC936DRAFT_149757 [Jimgerdemannia flammicorona]
MADLADRKLKSLYGTPPIPPPRLLHPPTPHPPPPTTPHTHALPSLRVHRQRQLQARPPACQQDPQKDPRRPHCQGIFDSSPPDSGFSPFSTRINRPHPAPLPAQALKAVILERTGKSDEALQLCQEVKKAQPTDEAVLQATTTVYRELGKRAYFFLPHGWGRDASGSVIFSHVFGAVWGTQHMIRRSEGDCDRIGHSRDKKLERRKEYDDSPQPPYDDEIVAIYEAAAKKQPQNEEFGNHWFMAMVRNGDYKGQKEAALKLHKSFKGNKYLFWAIMSLVLQASAWRPGGCVGKEEW